MFQKSIIGIALILSSASALAAPALPFVGARTFNFMGGTGTGLSIQISKNGMVVIKSYGEANSFNKFKPITLVSYKGAYKTLMPNGYGGYYKFTSSKAYEIQANGKMAYGCLGDDSKPCVSDLYK